MNFSKTVLVWSMCTSLILVGMAGTTVAEDATDQGWTPDLVIKELMPVVDPEMLDVRQMFIGVDTQIRSTQLAPSPKGGITNTRVAILGEQPGSTSLTLVAHEPQYRMYQILARGYTIPEFIPTLSWAGAEHILLGTVSFKGFTFESDATFPLHFKLVQARGYVYLCGRGTVTTPEGKTLSLGGTREVSDFISDLQAPQQLAREAATEALGWLVDTEEERDAAVPALMEALKDEALEVRRNAAAALGRIGDPRAREGLEAALQDQDRWVRDVVADALKKLQ
jgi:hypothetical protein